MASIQKGSNRSKLKMCCFIKINCQVPLLRRAPQLIQILNKPSYFLDENRSISYDLKLLLVFYLQYFQMEKIFKGFLFLLLICCTLSQQQIVCQLCQRVKQCDQSLLYDGNIDLIYNSIAQQLSITDYPLKIECVKTDAEATYTFSWSIDVYQAIVDLKTRAYKVIKSQQNNAVQSVESVQNALGVRDSSILQTNENIIGRIDQDIMGKYFANINAKCVSILPVQGGYHAIYEKADFSRIEFDAFLSNSAGNTFISYKVCQANAANNRQAQTANQGAVYGANNAGLLNGQAPSNIWFNVQSNPTPITINPSQVSIKPAVTAPIATDPQIKPCLQVQPNIKIQPAPKSQQPQQPQQNLQTQPVKPSNPVIDPAPVIGGYTQIQANDDGVLKIVNFLKLQFGSIISNCLIVKAERQLVSGFNYRLTIGVEGSSAQYVIVVYQRLDGVVSITSATLTGYKNNYSFSALLTQNQLSTISYFNNLQADLSAQGSLLTSDSILDSVQRDFPYFRIVYHNKAYKQIIFIILYDVLNRQLSIIKQDTTAYPTPTPVQVPAPVPKPTPAPTPTPVPAPQQSKCPAGYEQINSTLRNQSYISKYIDILAANEPRCSVSSLVNIYCKSSDRNSLLYIFVFADGTNKQYSASCDYIQYTIKNWKGKTTTASKVANCQIEANGQCTKCSPKYYLNSGKCIAIPVECSDFNDNTNKCEGCYHGYYLDLSGVCQKADYLCETSDRRGNCLSCFNNYRLTIRGRCIYVAIGASEALPEQENNPLCSKFNSLTCLSCVQGCYMNANGFCKIPDPNCINFDEAKQICRICVDSYSISQTSKTCVPIAKNQYN